MNETECIEEQHHVDHYLFPVIYVFVMVISIPANVGSLCVSCLQMKKKNELGVYLFGLSLSDLLYSSTLPLWIHYTWNEDNWTFSPALCKVSAFLMYVNFYSSTAFLSCISLDRYLAVVYPLKFPYLRTRRIASFISLSIWIVETSFNAIIIWKDETSIERCGTNKSYILCFDKYPLEKWQSNFNVFRTCTGYVIPLVIIIFCNQKVYQAVKHNQATESREKKRIVKLLLSVTLTFFLCFTPFHAMLLILSVGKHSTDFGKQIFKLYRITVALTSLNCVADPILYCFVSETGRSDIWNLFRFCHLPSTTSDPGMELEDCSSNRKHTKTHVLSHQLTQVCTKKLGSFSKSYMPSI
ncbi:G-protein coupled receptor 65 isoform X1 [Phascolarctos cinereus]|uniref:G-protein coupled receptor 65 n=1 Tax=Phascolarctos cinereus TaxID=38626 RepID=A0A6P5LDN2_PHACI|nr:psychosine receptor isoform X1 [Phascolarctos cinereus]XP_020856008.1 psychosine receptor isoform X1 [Phascolarctos cinereus]XP_020856009.1 psychosine receptor isoform X1 [Phascolarctos cinereus]